MQLPQPASITGIIVIENSSGNYVFEEVLSESGSRGNNEANTVIFGRNSSWH